MMKIPARAIVVLLQIVGFTGMVAPLSAQPANTSQHLVFAGLRSVGQQGQINAVQTDRAGNLYLLLNQGDGVRILKTDGGAGTVLAQAQLGATGDVGVALAIDPLGDIYITGISTSTALAGTTGAAVQFRTDASTNSFLAKFDSALNPLFVTFTGGSRITASALAVTQDAAFVTGVTYAANLPVTSNAIQQAPAFASTGNGFVERFSSDGKTLVYATYLTGANGDTAPAAIAADATDAVYLVGETSAKGYPTVNALVPTILSNPSGFLTCLTPIGDAISFSTFIPGTGLTSIALDSTGQTLLIAGSVALGQFPVDTVAMPLVPTNYQVLLRIPIDGSGVQSSTLLAPANQSFVSAGASGDAWVDGVLTSPLLPLTPLATVGGGFAVHVPAGLAIDQTARFGGLANQSPTYASLPIAVTSVAVDFAGQVLIAGGVQPTASGSLLASETYDLPLLDAPTTAFPSTISDAAVTAATCSGSLCSGSAAYLARLDPNSSAPALSFSMDDLPFVILRNLGSAPVNGLHLTATGSTLASNCPATLYPGNECNVLLAGGMAGSITATSSNLGSQTISYPRFTATSGTSKIVYYPKELDFGIQTSTSSAATRTITVTNLGTTSQTFASTIDAASNPKSATASPFSEVASDCTMAGSMNLKVLGPGGTCHITIGLTAYPSATSDGFLSANWSIGSRDVLLSGYSQASSLSVSPSQVDFGTQYSNGHRLPRFLYLSNTSTAGVTHSVVSLPTGSPFAVTDRCQSVIAAGTVCQIRLDYLSPTSPSTDSTSLALDAGISVLLTGKTLPPPTVTATTLNPNLGVTPSSVTFGSVVAVTSVSGATQTVMISNNGQSPFALTLSITGDFIDSTNCGTFLAANQNCSVIVSFAPSQPGGRQGLLLITAGSGTAYVALSGTATAILPANNGTLAIGSVPAGQPLTQFYKILQPFTSLTATAIGPYKTILIEDVGFGPGSPSGNSYAATSTGTCHNCWLGIQFLPVTAGGQAGSLTLQSTPGGSAYVLGLTGTGLPVSGLILTPLPQDFGTVPVHSSSSPQLFTLTNLATSGIAITVSQPVTTGDFVISPVATGGVACVGTLAFSASCMVAVEFSPTATGNRVGSLAISGSGTTSIAALSGTATADPGIAIQPLGLTFANVPGLASTMQTISVTNTSTASLNIGYPTLTTTSFRTASTCGNLQAGATCSINVTFLPGNAITADTLSLPVTWAVGTGTTTAYSVALDGAYTSATAGLQVVPGAVEYGATAVGTPSLLRLFTLNNLSAKSLAVSVNLPRQFVLAGSPCIALAPNASCNFAVSFAPLTNGDIPGTITAVGSPSDGTSTLSGIGYVEGFGTGRGSLTINGGLIVGGVYSFGQVTSGQSASQIFTVANLNPIGSPGITVRRVTSGPPFLSTTTCGAPLQVGQTCTVTVTYAPANQVPVGTVSPPTNSDAGSLILESDAASGPDIINLSGQAGASVATLPNTAPLATYAVSQSSLSFAVTPVGSVSAPQSITLTNTGNVTLQVTAATATPDFGVQSSCATVIPGTTCMIAVSSMPQSAGVHIASLQIASDAATSLEFVSLIGNAATPPLSLSPTSLDFGSVLNGNSLTIPMQASNTSGAPVIITAIGTTGDYAAVSSCPASGISLAANAGCTISVTFRPTGTGIRSGMLSLASSATTLPLNFGLTGIGTQSELVAGSSALAFGNILLGNSASASLTLLNAGSTAISRLSLTSSGDFTVSVPCPQTVLAPGSSCAIGVTFAPTALGSRSGTLTILSSDAASPMTIPLSGIGVPGGTFAITVNGGATGSDTVVSGTAATYLLTGTPAGGFAGTVALTCTPVLAAPYASCSIVPSIFTFSAGVQTSVVTINTITSPGSSARLDLRANALETVFACLLLPGLLTIWKERQQFRHRRMILLALLLSACSMLNVGCAGEGQFNMLYTPAGTYQYQVTASSTSGVPQSQTVTLNLIVTGR